MHLSEKGNSRGSSHVQTRIKESRVRQQSVDSATELRKALTRRSKAELVSVLLEPQDDRGILRELGARFDVAPASAVLVAATRRAIADATDFDEREINCNFDYDYQAYEEVKRNLTCLIASEQLPRQWSSHWS